MFLLFSEGMVSWDSGFSWHGCRSPRSGYVRSCDVSLLVPLLTDMHSALCT